MGRPFGISSVCFADRAAISYAGRQYGTVPSPLGYAVTRPVCARGRERKMKKQAACSRLLLSAA